MVKVNKDPELITIRIAIIIIITKIIKKLIITTQMEINNS